MSEFDRMVEKQLMVKQIVKVDIAECDIEMFEKLVHSGQEFDWSFPDQYGREVTIQFVGVEDE